MTIQTDTRVTDEYLTDGIQKRFDFAFPIFIGSNNEKGLEVRIVDELSYSVVSEEDYNVVKINNGNSGYVNFTDAPASGLRLIVVGATPLEQQLDITNSSNFNGESVEKSFDKNIALLQEFTSNLKEEIRQRIANNEAVNEFVANGLKDLKEYSDQLAEKLTLDNEALKDELIRANDSLKTELQGWVVDEFPSYAENAFNEIFDDFRQRWEQAIIDLSNSIIDSSMIIHSDGRNQEQINDFILAYGGCLPYDATKENYYYDGAFLNANGVLKQWDATNRVLRPVNFGLIPISNGGTGGTTTEEARANLDVFSKDEVLDEIDKKPSGLPIGHQHIRIVLRSKIPDGELALDGQLLNRADYPDLWAYAQNTGLILTDTVWLSTPLNRVCYSSGNGSTTFRIPDINGIQSGSLKSLVMRGDGYSPSGTALGDAIRNITGSVGLGGVSNALNPSGALGKTISTDDTGASHTSVIAGQNQKVIFDASLVVPTADENRPVSGFGVWVVVAKGLTESLPSVGKYPTLTGGNTWNGTQNVVGDLSVSGTFNANIKPLLNASGDAPVSACRAWVHFTCVNNVVSIKSAFNVSSVVRLGMSNFKITYTVAMPTEFNAPLVSGDSTLGSNSQYAMSPAIRNITSTSCEVFHNSPAQDFKHVILGVFA